MQKVTVSDDVIDDKYKPSLNYSKDKKTQEISKYPPNLKVSLEKPMGPLYVKEGKSKPIRIDVEPETCCQNIAPGDYIRPIIELKGLWMSTMGFGTKWRFAQGRVYKRENAALDMDITGGGESDTDGEGGVDDADDGLSDHERQTKQRKLSTDVADTDDQQDEV